ncbi:MAG: hypothetical protein M0R80_08585 [Proteobacteria bacterium]|jgi:hypothetical protein|nr:hypothetical protein [Pseudomonadota bacterium]
MRKLNYEYVKKYFEEQGCVLLEQEYFEAHAHMQYICSCGCQSSITWANFNSGYRCKSCGHKRSAEKYRLSQEYILQYFKDRGCVLLEEYIDANKPMQYICSCGNKDKIRFSKFKQGQRCRTCKYEKIREKMKQRKGTSNPRWNPNREYVQLNKLMHIKFRSMVANILDATDKRKNCKSAELLGYTRLELQEHLMRHPNWDNIRHHKWSIDHIFPIKAFLEHGITDLKIINCLENLRPMLCKENISKSSKYNKEDFRFWLATKGIENAVY